MFVSGKPCKPSLIFVSKAKGCLRGAYFVHILLEQALVLLTNISLAQINRRQQTH
jgi:hypothetical protein